MGPYKARPRHGPVTAAPKFNAASSPRVLRAPPGRSPLPGAALVLLVRRHGARGRLDLRLDEAEVDAAVLGAAERGGVGRDGLGLTEALGAQAVGLDALGDEVVHHGLGAP